MRILVIGGGIGGLALTAGLRRQGFDVTVFERDTDVSVTAGYHITLDGMAQQALAELVSAEHLEALLASAAAGRLREPDVSWDRRGRLLGRAPVKGGDPGIDVDRVTLRRLLARAAGGSLMLGGTFTGFDRLPGGRVGARFEDGSRIEGDVLVGADGTHSAVARQLAGGPTNRPTGLLGICGRTPAAGLKSTVRDKLGARSSFAVGPHGTALYLGYLDPVGHAVLDAPELRDAVTTGPTYIWGAMFTESDRTRSLRGITDAALRDETLRLLRGRGWAPDLLEVVSRSEPEGVALFRFHAASSDPDALAPWPASNVTALGDAVHATPPTAGQGAGAAIRDAASLVRELVAVRGGEKTVPVAIHDFEREMRQRGGEVITRAMKTVHQVLATDTAIGATATRAALPIVAGLTALSRRTR